ERCQIDPWFLREFQALALDPEEPFSGERSFKSVDTCAAEFPAQTPYYYSGWERQAAHEVERGDRPSVVILGAGPNRIGQGIEFGGQTPLKLAAGLAAAGVPLLGTSVDAIDLAEDRGRFGRLLDELGYAAPPYATARNLVDALAAGEEVGYPLLVRPSYVLGGRAMEIVYSADGLEDYLRREVGWDPTPGVVGREIFLDRFLENAVEADVDALCDGEDVWIGGIMQHVEEAGVHSGDSACVLPPHSLGGEIDRKSTRLN